MQNTTQFFVNKLVVNKSSVLERLISKCDIQINAKLTSEVNSSFLT